MPGSFFLTCTTALEWKFSQAEFCLFVSSLSNCAGSKQIHSLHLWKKSMKHRELVLLNRPWSSNASMEVRRTLIYKRCGHRMEGHSKTSCQRPTLGNVPLQVWGKPGTSTRTSYGRCKATLHSQLPFSCSGLHWVALHMFWSAEKISSPFRTKSSNALLRTVKKLVASDILPLPGSPGSDKHVENHLALVDRTGSARCNERQHEVK